MEYVKSYLYSLIRWNRCWQNNFKEFMMKEWISEEMERIKNTVSENKNNKSKNP
jgi:hypothetical protein